MLEPHGERRNERIDYFAFFSIKKLIAQNSFSIHESTQMTIASNCFENVCNHKHFLPGEHTRVHDNKQSETVAKQIYR